MLVNTDEVVARVQAALERGDFDSAIQVIEALKGPDQAKLFSELDDEEQTELLPKLDLSDSADILEDMDEGEAAKLAASLPTETVARIVDEMEPDEAADLLGDLPPQRARDVLARLEDPEEIRPLLYHPDDSAGGLMTSEFLALRPLMTAQEAIEALRAWNPDTETVYYLFVVDEAKRLVGVVSLRQLVLARPGTLIRDIMDPDVIHVRLGTDQEEVAHLMSHYDLLALPVVDDEGVLLGIITVDDVMDVIEDEATEDIQRLGGAEPLDQPYLETGVLTVARKRIGWLMLLFVTGTLTGTVLRLFENELQAVVALSFYVPLLIGTGGNAGSQTTSTIIRALGVGDIEWKDALRTLWHEWRTGLVLGLGMALMAYIRAVTWDAPPLLALTVSLASFIIVLWANSLGALLPVLADRLGIDPATVSGPVMSTLVDATGLFIYLSIAKLLMGI
ncbi:MAG: magnesium transporter [Anaerolineae bacterium]|nr:MAG: magnesium transporter [Anaerolineae bacterium]